MRDANFIRKKGLFWLMILEFEAQDKMVPLAGYLARLEESNGRAYTEEG